MELVHVTVRVANPARPRRSVSVECLVDSGAVYSVIPAGVLRRLGIRAHSSRTFTLADGTRIERPLGDAILGFILGPIRRELRPLPMVLG